MSIIQTKYIKIYNLLKESIDWKNSPLIKIQTDIIKRVNIENLNIGILIQNFPKEYIDDLRVGSVLYNNYNPETYYNFGFEVDELTDQQYKTNYKTLSKILGIVTKSLFEWIKKNNPEVITIFSDAKSQKEINKKLSIFGSILQGNKDELKSIGYKFDGGYGGNRIVIIKYE